MSRASLLPLLLLLACAHAEGAAPRSDRTTAQRIYAVAEQRYAEQAYDEAVSLMRHALLQLPTTAEHDHLRHQLVLRMAHTQLMEFAASGERASLHDAQQMLTRYLERHEQLFGDGETARSERGEVYELLHQVETRLEPPVIERDDEGDEGDEGDDERPVLASADAPAVDPTNAPAPAEPAPAEPTDAPRKASTMADAPVSAASSPAARRTDHEGGEIRDVVVPKQRRIRLASLDDPRVMARLRSDFSDPFTGLVLTRPGIEPVHAPRLLVRGHSRLAGAGDRAREQLARRTGQSLVLDAREALRGCYAAAFSRQPLLSIESEVEASIHPDGSISHVRIVDGGLVDGLGDACLIEALQRATVPPLDAAAEPVRVQVALQFFFEESVSIVEGTGEQAGPGDVILRPNPKPDEGLPPIDKFVK